MGWRALAWLLASALVAPTALARDSAVGRALYEGHHPALANSYLPHEPDARLPPAQAACTNCHRPSGLGSFEGGAVVPPIASGMLNRPYDPSTTHRYSPTSTLRIRPAYDAAALRRLLTEGVTPDGLQLSGLMPRYRLSEAEAAQLLDYLRHLGTDPTPGIEDDQVHFAVITSDEVTPGRVDLMLGMLDTFIAQKNAGTRGESARRRSALRNEQTHTYTRYRRWVLHHWTLRGDPSTWEAQLDTAYRAQPVFGMLTGMSERDWSPVQAFCERQRMPCMLPITPMPARTMSFYTAYFSGGLWAQARWLAAQEPAAGDGPSWLLLVDDDAGASTRMQPVMDELVRGGHAVRMGSTWRGETVVVSALAPAQVAARLHAATPPPSAAGRPVQVHLLAGASAPQPLPPSLTWPAGADVGWVTDQKPVAQAQALARARAWWRTRGIEPTDEALAAQVLLAATTAVETLVHVDDSFSREYCLEKLEHNLENMPPLTTFPRLSIGPGQRIAAKSIWRWTPPR